MSSVRTAIAKIKVIILDRDGVINEDAAGYIKSPDEWCAIVGSLPAIAKLNLAGYKVVVASNQSGIARGYFSLDVLEKIHLKMQQTLAMERGHLDGIFICPHGSDERCSCRKPSPGLILQVAREFEATPEEMLLIGDSMCDLVAAHNAGCAAMLVKTGNGEKTLHELTNEGRGGIKDNVRDNIVELGLQNIMVFDNLASAVAFILKCRG